MLARMLAPNGVGWGVPHRLEKGTLDDVPVRKCASKDAGPRTGWIVRSHIGWGGE